MVGSHPRYSARPEHTPANILSLLDFLNFAGITYKFGYNQCIVTQAN